MTKIETIHVVLVTHLDIGYTGTPDRVQLEQKDHLDTALRYCDEMPDFKYTIETTWVLREWLRRTDDPKRIRKMVDLIRQGRIELCGVHTTMHSSVCGPEELSQMCYEGRRLQEELGVEIVTAIQNDVPGYPWSYPQILKKSGMKYLFTGINTLLAGGMKIPLQDNPFYWEGLDGSRILLFVHDGYCWPIYKRKFFELFACAGDIDEADKDLNVYMKELEEAGYPHDSFLFMASPGDNLGPERSMNVINAVRKWNADGRTPRLQISTPREYFEDIEKKHAGRFPVYRGDWPASWEWDLVKERGPMSTTCFRRTQTNLLTTEKLHAIDSVLKGSLFPRMDIEKAYEGLLLYGEHSAPEGHGYGAHLTRREFFWGNQEHFNYANRAFNQTETLLERGKIELAHWVDRDANKIVVFNPLSWERTDTVRLPRTVWKYNWFGQHAFTHLRDVKTGETIACDNATMSEIGGDGVGDDQMPSVTFVARNVPAFGFRVYEAIREPLPADDPDIQIPAPLPSAPATSIENAKYRVEVDPATGAITSLFDKDLQRELVHNGVFNGRQMALNALTSADDIGGTAIEFSLVKGTTFQRLEIRRPGTWFPETHIRLANDSDQVEITNVLDRSAWKTTHREDKLWAAELQFPFLMQSAKTRLVVSGPIGFRRIPEDLLPGVANNGWASSAFLSADDGEVNVMVSSPTDYLFMRSHQREENLFGVHTQIIWQMFDALSRSNGQIILPYTEPEDGGRFVRRYAITSRAGSFDPIIASRFGWGFRSEMIGHYAPARTDAPKGIFAEPCKSLVEIDDEAVAVTTLRRSLFPKQDHHIIRLQELTGRAAKRVKIAFAAELPVKWVAQSDMVERKGKRVKVAKNAVTLEIGPFETVTLAVGFGTK